MRPGAISLPMIKLRQLNIPLRTLSPSFSDPQYPWKTDSIVVNFGEIELIDGEGMLIGRGSKEVNFQLVHSSPQK